MARKWVYEDDLPCRITPEMFAASRVIDGVRMYPGCERCGAAISHEDDGPRLCRFCNQYTPADPSQAISPQ